jgi:transcription elongation factor GreA
VGKALLGRKIGETVHIQVDDRYGYDMVVKAIEKGQDDSGIPLNTY